MRDQDEASGGRVENEIIRLFFNVSAVQQPAGTPSISPGREKRRQAIRVAPRPSAGPAAACRISRRAVARSRPGLCPRLFPAGRPCSGKFPSWPRPPRPIVRANGNDFKRALESFGQSVRKRLPPGAIAARQALPGGFLQPPGSFFQGRADLRTGAAAAHFFPGTPPNPPRSLGLAFACLPGFLFHTFGMAARMADHEPAAGDQPLRNLRLRRLDRGGPWVGSCPGGKNSPGHPGRGDQRPGFPGRRRPLQPGRRHHGHAGGRARFQPLAGHPRGDHFTRLRRLRGRRHHRPRGHHPGTSACHAPRPPPPQPAPCTPPWPSAWHSPASVR